LSRNNLLFGDFYNFFAECGVLNSLHKSYALLEHRYDIMIFIDRVDAGQKLAQALSQYKGEDLIVFALPRGGVVLGHEISKHLGAPLDLIVTRKIGYPGTEECAVCAVSEDGDMICDSSGMDLIDASWLRRRAEEEMAEAKRRREAYLKDRAPLEAQGKIAIIVDDGVATGLTLLLAIQELRHRQPKKIVVAVPVASSMAAEKIRKEADELIALEVPPYFYAVGAHYENFPQITDQEVIQIIESGGV
jgi:putative phosphoribosyl transferase